MEWLYLTFPLMELSGEHSDINCSIWNNWKKLGGHCFFLECIYNGYSLWDTPIIFSCVYTQPHELTYSVGVLRGYSLG